MRIGYLGGIIILLLVLNIGLVSADVFINEFMANPASSEPEWIELYYNGSASVNLSNWYINDTSNTRGKNLSGILNSTNRYIVFNESQVGIILNNNGDSIYLHNSSSNLINNITYSSSTTNVSEGRMHDGLPVFVTFTISTPNTANNRLPTGTIPTQNTQEDIPSFFNVSLYITDPDNDTMIFTIANENISQVNCTVLSQTNITLQSALNWNGIANCTVGANDTYGAIDKLFSVNVTIINDAPTITGVPNQTAIEDINKTLNVTPYISDVDNVTSSLIITENSAYATVNGQIITFNYPNGSIGGENITIVVSDGSLSNSQNITVTVTAVNDAPVIAQLPNITFYEEGYNDSIDLDDYVQDEEYSDANISWSYSDTKNLSININGTTHILNISADKNWYGVRNITLTATDYGGSSSTTNVTVIVSNINDEPYFTSTPSLTATEAIEYSYDADANDIDSNLSQLNFSIVTAPTGATINSTSGLFKWIPKAAQTGVNQIDLQIRDTEGNFSTQKFNVTVVPVLDIIDIKIKNQSVDNNGTVTGIAPGDILNVEYKVKNRFPNEANKAITGINEIAIISAYLLQDNTSGFNLEGQETKSISHSFQIPYTANIINFGINISTSGVDLYNNNYSSSKKVNLVLDRDFHRIQITNKTWSKDNLTCLRSTNLNVALANTGNWSEQGTVDVYNANTNTNQTKTFSLSIAEKTNVSFAINTSNAKGNEEFSITVKYWNNYYTVQDSAELKISSCLDSSSLNNLLKVNESQVPTWSSVDLKKYTYGNTTGLTYIIAGENISLIDCSTTLNGTFSCNAPSDDLYGTSTINMSVGDVYEQFIVTVLSVNDAPNITLIPNVVFDEGGSNSTVDLDDYVTDPDNSDSELSWSVSNNQNVSVSINSNTHVVTFATIDQNWYGNETINFTVSDNQYSASQKILAKVIQQYDDLPSITNSSPGYNPKIGDSISQSFNITISDPDGISPTINWYVNGTDQSAHTKKFSFRSSNAGEYVIKANITNATSNYEKIWNLIISKTPITTYDGTIKNVNESNVNSFKNLTILNSNAKIDFGNEEVNSEYAVDIDRYVKLQNGIVGMDTDAVGFGILGNHPAKITMYGLRYPSTPTIYYNSGFEASGNETCTSNTNPSCTNISYADGTLSFDISHFTVFFLPTPNLPPTITSTPVRTAIIGKQYSYDVDATDPEGASLVYVLTQSPSGMAINSITGLISWTPSTNGTYNVSVSVTDGANIVNQSFDITVKEGEKLSISDLDVKVEDETAKNLNNGDKISKKAKPGDRVKFDIEVRNDYPSSSDIQIEDIEVTVTIKDIDDGDDLEEDVDIDELDAGDDDSVSVEFTIPTLVKEDIYDVEIEVNGEDENGNDHEEIWNLQLEVKKDKHSLLVDKAGISGTIRCDRNPTLELRIVNIGREDEDDVSIEIKNEELGMDIKELAELEEGDDEDSVFEKTYTLRISNEAKEGTYPITIKTYYDNKESGDKTVELIVEKCFEVVTPVKEEAEVEVITTKPTVKPTEPVTISFMDESMYLTLLTIIFVVLLGVLIFLTGAVIIRLRKR